MSTKERILRRYAPGNDTINIAAMVEAMG